MSMHSCETAKLRRHSCARQIREIILAPPRIPVRVLRRVHRAFGWHASISAGTASNTPARMSCRPAADGRGDSSSQFAAGAPGASGAGPIERSSVSLGTAGESRWRTGTGDATQAAAPARDLPLRNHTERALNDYFASLNGHRPARLYDLVLREVEEPLFRTVLDYAAGQPEPGGSDPRHQARAPCARSCASSGCRPDHRSAAMDQPIRRALLSVSDKTGLIDLAARAWRARGIELLSTGGTAHALADAGIAVREVASVHRLPRDHGRARQDAAPADPRRPARPPRHRRGGHGARTASSPSTCWS